MATKYSHRRYYRIRNKSGDLLTLMNTVNSDAYGISDFDFQKLHFLTKYFLIFFMIIGRVELLSLLLIAKKFLFKY